MRQNLSRTHRLVLLVLTALLALPLAPVVADPPTGPPALGTNLAFLRSNSGEYPFVNVFKTSTPWVSILNGVSGAGTLDEVDGEILSLQSGQEAATFLFESNVGRYPAGDYIVLYDGDGDLEYGGSGTLHRYRSAPGRDVVHVDPQMGELHILLTRTNPAMPLTNIRVLPPGGACSNDPYQVCKGTGDPVCGAGTCDLFETHHATQIFHPTFLNNIRRFGVLRFMDWMDTIEGGYVNFSRYTEESDARWNPAPIEILAELGNRTGADIWVNVPHNASDAFITEIANRLHGRLDPARKVWVEFSNEVWNPAYAAFMEVTQAGCAAHPGLACEAGLDPNDGVPCDGHRTGNWFFPNCEEARIRETSERTVHAWQLFETAFGGTTRLVRVMSSQSGESDLHDGLLQWQSAHQDTDVLATAAYFGIALGGNLAVPGWDLDTLFGALDTDIQDTILLMKSDFYFLEANYPNLPVVHYEGGQHLQAFGPITDPGMEDDLWELNTLFDDANQDPRMGALYDQLFNAWSQTASPLFCHFTNVHTLQSWGRFGALEYQNQPHGDSVKYQALLRELDRLGVP